MHLFQTIHHITTFVQNCSYKLKSAVAHFMLNYIISFRRKIINKRQLSTKYQQRKIGEHKINNRREKITKQINRISKPNKTN